jgi:hypothetical protein
MQNFYIADRAPNLGLLLAITVQAIIFFLVQLQALAKLALNCC